MPPRPEAPISPLPTLGALALEDGRCRFRVWAPRAQAVDVHFVAGGASRDRVAALQPEEPVQEEQRGYFSAVVDDAAPGTRYFYRLTSPAGSVERPDPASRFQPDGVHGPSEIVDPAFPWSDGHWRGLPLSQYILYELHVGTFSPEGTFDGILPHLDALADLGITAVELMPVAQFPGGRNWGYDGVYPFAVQNTYGGPAGLKRLVDACHRKGLAVVLDVVYNHLGPEGNYLAAYAPYFTDRYKTPWGSALNFDGPHSDEVRRYFLENALHWVTDFHIDALRLDAVHAIVDPSPVPFLQQLASLLHRRGAQLNRRIYTIAESDAGDPRMVRSQDRYGMGLDAQWNDDFHHALHAALTGETTGYYADFGGLAPLAKAYEAGYVYTGEYSVYRQRRHGADARDIPDDGFVVYAQNHDQIGNRMLGERLSQLVSFEKWKLAAAAVLLAPYVPLLFMGEEYAETAPFQYFVSHGDPALVAAVRKGRHEEFAAFAWRGEAPDPQAEATFERSQLNHRLKSKPPHATALAYVKELIRLRKSIAALAEPRRENRRVEWNEADEMIWIQRWSEDDAVLLILNFAAAERKLPHPLPAGKWRRLLDSAAPEWLPPGTPQPSTGDSGKTDTVTSSPHSALLYHTQSVDH